MNSSLSVANKLLQLAKADNGNTLNPMQLIKLTYLCHGWMLGAYNRPLISENVKAWKYGPVISELYSEIKQFRDQPVKVNALEGCLDNFDHHEDHMIGQIYKRYGRKTGSYLSGLTHKKGTPWELTFKRHRNDDVISNDLIEEHFSMLMSSQLAE